LDLRPKHRLAEDGNMNDVGILREATPLTDLKAQGRGLTGEIRQSIARVLGRCDFLVARK
jgi:hypothetical protein